MVAVITLAVAVVVVIVDEKEMCGFELIIKSKKIPPG